MLWEVWHLQGRMLHADLTGANGIGMEGIKHKCHLYLQLKFLLWRYGELGTVAVIVVAAL